MSFIGATGFNSFKQELDTEIQNTSNYINSVVLAEGIVDSNLTTRITDLEQNVGETADISNNILATGFHLAIDNLENNIGTPKTSTSINEPTITTGTYVSLHQVDTEHKYILYKHDGSTNTSTSYSITFNENTICDIFVLGAGGAGGGNLGGGGSSGGLSFLENATIPQGTYNIVVGNGGTGGSGNGFNGNNSSFLTNDATPLGIVAYGGGGGTSTTGGSTTSGSYTGTFIKTSINHFVNNGVVGGGGGGAGGAGSGDDGGDGIKNISSIDFKTHFNITNNSTIGEENNNYLYFGGGGGKNSGDNGLGNVNSLNTITGGGGKGGSTGQNGNDGSEGLVIIRYKFSTISVSASGLNLQIHNLKNEIGEAPTISPLYVGTGMHREITLLEQGVGLPTTIQGAWMSHGNGLYGITDSIMTQLGMTDYAVAGNSAEIFVSQLTGTFATLLGWIAGTGSTITIAQAINKLDERIKHYEDDIKDNLQQGDVVVILVNDRTDDMYFLNAGNIGIGYSKNTQLSAKLHVNGDFKCEDVNCDDIVSDKIGIGTSTNHTGTLLDVRGFASFGDGITAVQAFSLRSQSGLWNITSDNNGNAGNNQFVISSLRTIAGIPNVETKFLLIENGNGNIGIGKTPAYKLDVDGDVNIGSLAKYKIGGANLQYSDIDNTPFTSIDATTLAVNSGVLSVIGGGSSSPWTTTGNDIYYNTGLVGIGKIPTAPYKLDVDGYIKSKNLAQYNQNLDFRLNKTDSVGNVEYYMSIFNDNSLSHNNMNIYVNKNPFNSATSPNLIFSTSGITRMLIGKNGNIGISNNITTEPTYKLEVNGSVNTTASYYINGTDVRNYTPFYNNQIVQTIFAPYKRMAIKSSTETGWTLIDASSTGFIVSITPTSIYSGILLDIKMHFGLHWSTDSRWWGARLYRRYGASGSWLHVTGAGGDETSNDSSATSNGTECWFADTSGVNSDATIGTCSASYMDFPQTTNVVYYTIAIKCRLGETSSSGNGNDTFYINRAHQQNDAFRPSPMSSWKAQEIWRTTTSIRNVS